MKRVFETVENSSSESGEHGLASTLFKTQAFGPKNKKDKTRF